MLIRLEAEQTVDVGENGDASQGLWPVRESQPDPIPPGLGDPIEQERDRSAAAALDTTKVDLDLDWLGLRLGWNWDCD